MRLLVLLRMLKPILAATKGIVLRNRLQLLMYNNMYRIMFDRRFESVDDPLFLKLKALNGERSRLAQSFEYNFGDFIPIILPFLRGYRKLCQEIKAIAMVVTVAEILQNNGFAVEKILSYLAAIAFPNIWEHKGKNNEVIDEARVFVGVVRDVANFVSADTIYGSATYPSWENCLGNVALVS
ncbi:hypothetical protein AgCh_017151 [Apium graveolens]